ncbi:MAG TPA: hypothetical protein VF986_06165 [Actinomycetota bacterium]
MNERFVILALADGGREPAYRRAWAVALALAARGKARLLLVDRSQETWADTPHHLGPYGPEELRRKGRHHLDGQLAEAEAKGVEVLVWIPSLPLPESYYQETLSHNRVDLAVLPERFEHPKLLDRLAGTRAARMAKALAPRVPVVQVFGDGRVALL